MEENANVNARNTDGSRCDAMVSPKTVVKVKRGQIFKTGAFASNDYDFSGILLKMALFTMEMLRKRLIFPRIRIMS